MREVPAGEGNTVVQVHPLELNPVYGSAWAALQYLADLEPCECSEVLAVGEAHTAHCRRSYRHWESLVQNLRAALAKAGVTRESVESWEES